jgi:hypothetical protein
MKCLVASKAKQGETSKYHAMQALVAIPSHLGHGGEVGAARRLVNVQFCCCTISIHIQLLIKSNCIIKCTSCSRLISMFTCPRE